jgi:DNA primase
MNDFLLLSASKSSKTKRAAGTDSEVIKERPKSLVLTTAIEPFTLSELISRTCEIDFNDKHKNPEYMESDLVRKILQHRDVIISCLLKVVSEKILPQLDERRKYLTILRTDYKSHSMERNNEYLALLMLILKHILPHMPYYSKQNVMFGVESGEVEIRRRWIEYQNERSREMNTGSNDILKMLNGIVKDYLYIMKERNIEETWDSATGEPVFKFIHPEYGLELIKTKPREFIDKATNEPFTQVEIAFVGTSGEVVYAFDSYCKNKGLKNPYSSAAVFGRRLENDLTLLETQNWTLMTKEGTFPYFKILNGLRYYKFVNIIIS